MRIYRGVSVVLLLVLAVLLFSGVVSACGWTNCDNRHDTLIGMSGSSSNYGWSVWNVFSSSSGSQTYLNSNWGVVMGGACTSCDDQFHSAVSSRSYGTPQGYISGSSFRLEDSGAMGALVGAYVYVRDGGWFYPHAVRRVGAQCNKNADLAFAFSMYRTDTSQTDNVRADFSSRLFTTFPPTMFVNGNIGCGWSYYGADTVALYPGSVDCSDRGSMYLSPGVYYVLGGVFINEDDATDGNSGEVNFVLTRTSDLPTCGGAGTGGLSLTGNYFDDLSSEGYIASPLLLRTISDYVHRGLNPDSNQQFCELANDNWRWSYSASSGSGCCGDDGLNDEGNTAGGRTCHRCDVSVSSLGYDSGKYYWVNPEDSEAECSDGIDNDCDGQEGCDDPGCAGTDFCDMICDDSGVTCDDVTDCCAGNICVDYDGNDPMTDGICVSSCSAYSGHACAADTEDSYYLDDGTCAYNTAAGTWGCDASTEVASYNIRRHAMDCSQSVDGVDCASAGGNFPSSPTKFCDGNDCVNPPECTSGACCTGSNTFASEGTVCATETGTTCYDGDVYPRSRSRLCSGSSAACDGVYTSWVTDTDESSVIDYCDLPTNYGYSCDGNSVCGDSFDVGYTNYFCSAGACTSSSGTSSSSCGGTQLCTSGTSDPCSTPSNVPLGGTCCADAQCISGDCENNVCVASSCAGSGSTRTCSIANGECEQSQYCDASTFTWVWETDCNTNCACDPDFIEITPGVCVECEDGDTERTSCTPVCSGNGASCFHSRTCSASNTWGSWSTCNEDCTCSAGYAYNSATGCCEAVTCPGSDREDCTPACSAHGASCERTRTCDTSTGTWGAPYGVCNLNCDCDVGYAWNSATGCCESTSVSCSGNDWEYCTPACSANGAQCRRSRTCDTSTGTWGAPYGSCTQSCTCDPGYSWNAGSGCCEPICVPVTCYRDYDGDGYGDPLLSQSQCDSCSAGWVSNDDDCDDSIGVCTTSCVTVYRDADGDSYGNPSVTSYVCQGFGGYVNDNTDCDDGDALLAHQCCPAGSTDIEIFPKYNTVHWPDANRWDFAFHNDFSYYGNLYIDTAVRGCANTPNACWDEDLDVLVASGTVVDASGSTSGRSESYCSFTDCTGHGCAWRDCDISSTVCESNCGFDWLPPDPTTLPFGGYNGVGWSSRTECCGDDASEHPSAGACAISTDTSTLCCPASDMYNLDGRCVPPSACPDVMKGAPVWVDTTSTALYNALLARASVGEGSFCCNYNGQPQDQSGVISYPLGMEGSCTYGEMGCFMSPASVQVTPPELAGKRFCGDDDDCVLDLCSYERPFSVCEESITCTEEVDVWDRFDLENLDGMYRCDLSSYEVVTTCYPEVDPSAASDPACEVVVEEVCEIADPSVCQVLCDASGDNCVFGCPAGAYSCYDMTTYRNCDAPVTGNQECSTQFINIEPGACASTPVAVCNSFGCAPYECPMDGSSPLPSCAVPEFEVESSLCTAQSFCSELSCDLSGSHTRTDDHNLRCVTPTSSLGYPSFIAGSHDRSAGQLVCSPTPEVFDGDYWCPESFEYNYAADRCERVSPICDAGFIGSLTNGCDVKTGSTGFWNMYHDACLDTSSAIAPSFTYDSACCLDVDLSSGMGDYQVYTFGEEEAYVKVY